MLKRSGITYDLGELLARADGGLITVGRAAGNTLSMSALLSTLENSSAALTLSRRHAFLRKLDGTLQLSDNNTVNGTYVNGQKLQKGTWKVLNEGDVFSLGGPPTTIQPGPPTENPWTFTIRRLNEFLAANATPGRPVPRNAPRNGLSDSAKQVVVAEHAQQGTAHRAAAAAHTQELFSFGTEAAALAHSNDAASTDGRLDASAAEVARPLAARPRPARRHPQPEVIDLTTDDSPTAALRSPSAHAMDGYPAIVKKREGVKIEREPGPKQSKAREGGSPAARAAAATPAAAAPAAPPAVNAGLAAVKEQFACPICQDLVAPAYAMVPCGHVYCGECLAGWLANKGDCPTCREKCTAPPVRQRNIDGYIDAVVAQLDEEEQETRSEKQQQWEAGRQQFEKQLHKPWAAAAARGAPRHPLPGYGQQPALAGLPMSGSMMQAMMMALGGGGGFMPGPPHMPVPLPRAQRYSVAPHANEFRCEYAPPRGQVQPCTACGGGMGNQALRIGVRQALQSRHEHTAYSWYHLGCMPPGHWQDARVRGVQNLRGMSPADQSLVRERMRLS